MYDKHRNGWWTYVAVTKQNYCVHKTCKLPKNNQRFLWQAGYIFLGLAILLLKTENFTFFQILLFVFPTFIDIAYNNLDSKFWEFTRRVFFFLNLLVMVICILGLCNIMVDEGKYFTLNLEVIQFGYALPKKTIAIFIAADLVVPLMYYGTSPCQHSSHAIEHFRKNNRKEA